MNFIDDIDEAGIDIISAISKYDGKNHDAVIPNADHPQASKRDAFVTPVSSSAAELNTDSTADIYEIDQDNLHSSPISRHFDSIFNDPKPFDPSVHQADSFSDPDNFLDASDALPISHAAAPTCAAVDTTSAPPHNPCSQASEHAELASHHYQILQDNQDFVHPGNAISQEYPTKQELLEVLIRPAKIDPSSVAVDAVSTDLGILFGNKLQYKIEVKAAKKLNFCKLDLVNDTFDRIIEDGLDGRSEFSSRSCMFQVSFRTGINSNTGDYRNCKFRFQVAATLEDNSLFRVRTLPFTIYSRKDGRDDYWQRNYGSKALVDTSLNRIEKPCHSNQTTETAARVARQITRYPLNTACSSPQVYLVSIATSLPLQYSSLQFQAPSHVLPSFEQITAMLPLIPLGSQPAPSSGLAINLQPKTVQRPPLVHYPSLYQ